MENTHAELAPDPSHPLKANVSTRRHPDLFTPKEAAHYLGLKSERTLDLLRRDRDLLGRIVGKGYLYHREDLDACALRIFGMTRRVARTTTAVDRARR
jgi:hypothetical protein